MGKGYEDSPPVAPGPPPKNLRTCTNSPTPHKGIGGPPCQILHPRHIIFILLRDTGLCRDGGREGAGEGREGAEEEVRNEMVKKSRRKREEKDPGRQKTDFRSLEKEFKS